MKISVLTLFVQMFDALKVSVIGKALTKGLFELEVLDIRTFSKDKHKKCDDMPYGGGAGMLMTPQPIVDAFQSIDPDRKAHRIFLSPKGITFKQSKVIELAKYEHIILLCGHYEGVDQRVIDNYIDEEISIGDYILTGGELAAQVVIDCVARYLPGVLGNSDTVNDESFSDGLLEYPQYTRPVIFEGYKVPDVLLSGHHENVAKWRKEQSLQITKNKRRDLLENKNK